MNRKAPRSPRAFGRTTHLNHPATRRQLPSYRTVPGTTKLVGGWTMTAGGRLVQTWELQSDRPARRLVGRKRAHEA